MRYQDAYLWLLLISSLDVIFTLLVVFFWQGHEVNPLAAAVIESMGFGWAIVFKFATVMLAIVICEVVGRRDDRMGRRLSQFAVAVSAVPVFYTLILLFISEPPIEL
jgi:hypothetical protein